MALIAQITDLHMRPRGATAGGFVQTNTLTARAVDTLRALRPRPDVVLVTGDITDLAEPDAYALAAETLAGLDLPVLVLPGNHDRREPLRRAFAGWPGIAETSDDRICYVHRLADSSIVVLDSLVDGESFGRLGAEQIEWLEAMLEALPELPVLIAVHHPPVMGAIPHMDAMALQDADLFADAVRSFHKVRRIVCGHVHRLVIGQLAHVPVMCIPGVAHQVALSLEEDRAPNFVMEPATFALHSVARNGSVGSQLGYVERFDGPYPFAPGKGITWPTIPGRDRQA